MRTRDFSPYVHTSPSAPGTRCGYRDFNTHATEDLMQTGLGNYADDAIAEIFLAARTETRRRKTPRMHTVFSRRHPN